MSDVTQTNLIDAIGTHTIIRLLIVDPLPWNANEADHLFMLQEKINTYIAFIESGQIYKDYPTAEEASGFEIELVLAHAPSENAQAFFAALQPFCDELSEACDKDIDFSVVIAPEESDD